LAGRTEINGLPNACDALLGGLQVFFIYCCTETGTNESKMKLGIVQESVFQGIACGQTVLGIENKHLVEKICKLWAQRTGEEMRRGLKRKNKQTCCHFLFSLFVFVVVPSIAQHF
jgi:hypothetical protein